MVRERPIGGDSGLGDLSLGVVKLSQKLTTFKWRLSSNGLEALRRMPGLPRGSRASQGGRGNAYVYFDLGLALFNDKTNSTCTTLKNEADEYAFPNVELGTYTLTTVRSGFKKFEDKGIRIGTQSFITLDVALEVGQGTEPVAYVGSRLRTSR
jgi:hypothetical protein